MGLIKFESAVYVTNWASGAIIISLFTVCCRIVELCQENAKGINEDVILREMPSLKGQPLADAINRLTKKVWYMQWSVGYIFLWRLQLPPVFCFNSDAYLLCSPLKVNLFLCVCLSAFASFKYFLHSPEAIKEIMWYRHFHCDTMGHNKFVVCSCCYQ
jgi:hypothetical protein